jgi:hypothetical protein
MSYAPKYKEEKNAELYHAALRIGKGQGKLIYRSQDIEKVR